MEGINEAIITDSNSRLGRSMFSKPSAPPTPEPAAIQEPTEGQGLPEPAKETPPIENGNENKIEKQTQTATTDTLSKEDDKPTDIPTTDYIKQINEKTGREYKSVDDIISGLTKEVKPEPLKYPDFLSPFVKDGEVALPKEAMDILSIQASGGDVNNYFRVKGLDFEKLTGRENQKELFIRENLEKFNNDPEFAEMEFDAFYRNTYKTIEALEKLKKTGLEDDISDFEEANREELERERKYQVKRDEVAKAQNKKWQEETTTPKGSLPSDQGPTAEEIQAFIEKHNTDLDAALAGYKGYKIGGEDGYNVGLENSVKSKLEQLKSADSLFNSFKERFSIDLTTGTIGSYPKFIEAMHKLETLEQMVTSGAYEQNILERNKLKSLEAQRENPIKDKEVEGSPVPSGQRESLLAALRARKNNY